MEASDQQSVIRAIREMQRGNALQISYKAFGKHSNQSPYKKNTNRILQSLLCNDIIAKDTTKQPPVFSLAIVSQPSQPSSHKAVVHHSIELPSPHESGSLLFPNGPFGNLPPITPLNTGSPRPHLNMCYSPEESFLQTVEPSNGKQELIIFDLDQRANDIDKVKSTAWVIATASHHYNGRIPKNWKIIRATGDKKGEAYNRLLLHLSELLFTTQLINTKRIIVYSKNSMYQSFGDILTEHGIQFLQG